MLKTLSLAALLASAAPAAPVLLISIDGLRPQEWQGGPKSNANGLALPNLRGLAAGGAFAAVQGVLPSVTYPSHETLITGAAPARHRIVSNLTFDPLQRNDAGWFWYAADAKAPSLWQAAHDRGLKTLNVHWPVSVGAAGLDVNLPQIWRKGTADDAKLVAALAWPRDVLAGLEARLGAYADGIDESVAGDAVRVRFAATLLAELKPDFTTIYLAGLDHSEHEHGPDSAEARAVLAETDRLVGDLVAAARKARPDTVVVLVSDHGFAPVTRQSNLWAPLVQAGLLQLGADGKPLPGWQAMPWLAGGSAEIVLARPDDAALQAQVLGLFTALAADPDAGIDRGVAPGAALAMGGNAGIWINLKPGFTTGIDPAAAQGAPAKVKGMHGYFPDVAAMRSSLIINGGGQRGDLGLVDMRAIAPTIAKILGVALPSAEVPALP